MRISRLVTRTLRDDPPEAETASHRLMLRAGLIQQVAAGVYAYLPLAWRSLQKIEQIVREEMDAAAGQELRMPALQPLELWQQTDRDAAFGDNMFRLEDRRGRPLALAPTHEEVVTNIVKGNVQSYRDLPVILYQMQTKFRDEPRPRAGLVRVREFTMKDAYSFDADDDGLDDSYQAMAQAYRNVFRRCSIPVVMAEADSGAIGGKDSHEFLLPTDTGEDTVITCPGCGYAANAEKAEGVYPGQETPDPLPAGRSEHAGHQDHRGAGRVPGRVRGADAESRFLRRRREVVFVTIRGDLDVNEVKLKNALHCNELRLADDEEVKPRPAWWPVQHRPSALPTCAASPTRPSATAATSWWAPTRRTPTTATPTIPGTSMPTSSPTLRWRSRDTGAPSAAPPWNRRGALR